MSDDLQFRAGYSETVSYPGLIERSRAQSFDPDTDDEIFGNPDLEVSSIENFDLSNDVLQLEVLEGLKRVKLTQDGDDVVAEMLFSDSKLDVAIVITDETKESLKTLAKKNIFDPSF